MDDLPTQEPLPANPEAQGEEPEDDRGRRVRGPIIAVILLLLLLLTVCGLFTTVNEFARSRAQFLVRNAECLVCHTEVVAQMRLPSQHQPFISEHCTSCHTPHGRFLEVRQRNIFVQVTDSFGRWLRWGPFRWVFDTGQRLLAPGSVEGERETERRVIRELGRSELQAPLEVLCWSCHPGVAPDLQSEYEHQPFNASHCVSCHNPHASEYRPLLVGTDERMCGQCHPMRDLARPILHPPAENWQCRSCHKAHGSNYVGMLFNTQRIVCYTCHPSVAKDELMSVQHQPFGEGDCTGGCHEPHGAYYGTLLQAADPQLCYNCHPSIESDFGLVSHHPVGTQIKCGDCHQPHASNIGALLVKQQPALCFGCHTDIAKMTTLKVQHEPFSDDVCTVCHVPHGSSFTPLLSDPMPKLCYNCHPGVQKEFALKSHHPIGQNGLTCASCHDPHASNYQGLLPVRGNKLCFRCHGYLRANYEVSLHWDQPCIRCHKWHGSNFAPLLVKLNPPLCLDCHVPNHYYSGPKAHPTWPVLWDWHAKKPLTCTSTCHNPHGTQYKHMVRNFPPDWDGQCKQCHKGVGIWY